MEESPWKYLGTESVTSIPAGVVDWVLVGLRTGTDSASTVATRAAFIRSDGMVVDLDGTSPVAFPTVSAGSYRIVLRHRNHLAVMSASALALSVTSTLYDFTTGQDKAYGAAAMKELTTGHLWYVCGNGNGDGAINATDRNAFWRVQNGDISTDTITVTSTSTRL